MGQPPGPVPPQVRQLRLLQPYVLNCCYCMDGEIVAETLRVLKCLAQHLTWQKSSSFLVQITFTLRAFFEVVWSSDGPSPVSGWR